MKTLKEMNIGELRSLYIDHREMYIQTGCETFRLNAIEVHNEYLSRVAETVAITEAVEMKPVTIKVFFEQGYKWSVDVEGESESRITNVNKVDAMALARKINASEFNNKANIIAQKLNKAERKENMQWLHENTYTFTVNKAI